MDDPEVIFPIGIIVPPQQHQRQRQRRSQHDVLWGEIHTCNASGNASGNSTTEYLSRRNANADVHASSEITHQTPTLMETAICMMSLNGLITRDYKLIVETKLTKQLFTSVSIPFCELKRQKAINFVTYFCWGEIGSTQQYNQLPAKQRKRQRMRETVTLQYTFLYYLGR